MRIALFVLLALLPLQALSEDACDAKLPSELKILAAETFPEYRTPVVADNMQEDVDWNLQQKGDGCLAVARADFDGNEQTDVLIGLTERNGKGAKVVVALSREGSWELSELATWAHGRSRLYVDAEGAGSYERSPALEGPLEPGEEDHIECQNSVAIFGATESTGIAYCFKNHAWTYVWISD
jgi:hypothetical protein